MAFIHEKKGWPHLTWDASEVTPGLVRAMHKQGLLLGRMRQLGFALQAEAAVEVLTSDVVQSSAIEGERLDQADVRSSIARRLGLPDGAARRANRDVEGVVEVMLDATRNPTQPITERRLCGWHAALFPVGYSGTRPIAVGSTMGRRRTNGSDGLSTDCSSSRPAEANKSLSDDHERINQPVFVAVEQSCECGNLCRRTLVLESEEDNAVVRTFIAVNLLTEVLVVRDQNPVFRISLLENVVVGQAPRRLVDRKNLVRLIP